MPKRGETMPAETREKIRATLKGRKLSEQHRRRVSRGVIRYWALLPEGTRSGENWRPTKTPVSS
jgi:hypothetical protein